MSQAFEAFFESKSYEDAIRNAMSIGGDSDTAEGLYRASFAGFFLAEDPKYVIVTTFETPKEEGRSMHQGGQRPASAFAEIVEFMKGK